MALVPLEVVEIREKSGHPSSHANWVSTILIGKIRNRIGEKGAKAT
jgi:hypothetical protein